MRVEITIGHGAWTASITRNLVACPHVGDRILVGQHVITADTVMIGEAIVFVNEYLKFTAEDQLDEYVAVGWRRDDDDNR